MGKKKVAFSMVFVVVLLAVLFTCTEVKAQQRIERTDCVCDHYNDSWAYTINDTYTGTSVQAEGYYEYGYYDYFKVVHNRAYGGNYTPDGYSENMDEWFDDGMGYRDYWWTDGPWMYPYDPFNMGFPYYGQEVYFESYPSACIYVGGSTSSHFQWPSNPSILWWCGGSLAQVYN